MRNILIVFAVLLLMLTLLGTFGGSIQYSEPFYVNNVAQSSSMRASDSDEEFTQKNRYSEDQSNFTNGCNEAKLGEIQMGGQMDQLAQMNKIGQMDQDQDQDQGHDQGHSQYQRQMGQMSKHNDRLERKERREQHHEHEEQRREERREHKEERREERREGKEERHEERKEERNERHQNKVQGHEQQIGGNYMYAELNEEENQMGPIDTQMGGQVEEIKGQRMYSQVPKIEQFENNKMMNEEEFNIEPFEADTYNIPASY